MKLFSAVGIGWLLRRVPDIGGWLVTIGGGAYTFYQVLPPSAQHTVQQVLTGHWQDVTLGSAFGVIMVAFATWRSYKATVKPAIVTTDGTKVGLDKVADVAPQTAAHAEQAARTVAVSAPDRPIINILKGVFGK